MQRIHIQSELVYESRSNSDYIFNIQAAYHPWQFIESENVSINPFCSMSYGLGHTGQNRLAKMASPPGTFSVNYEAIVAVNYPQPTGQEQEMQINALPIDIIPYIWSSRYCESDALTQLANSLFGQIPVGFQRVEAICQWIRDNIRYEIGHTNSLTSTRNVLDMGVGVCRDFAHLGISFCRALNIPARFVTGYALFEDPPTDYHAIFEAYLGGRWILFDPTQMSPIEDLVRIATGRDASDTAFSTIFGAVVMKSMNPYVEII